jgi:hypothetical protein
MVRGFFGPWICSTLPDIEFTLPVLPKVCAETARRFGSTRPDRRSRQGCGADALTLRRTGA